MVKNFIIAATVFASGLSANCYECCDPCNVGGFYIGVGIGRSFSDGEWKLFQQVYDLGLPNTSERYSANTGGEGSTESITFGYGKQFCNRWFLGVEAFASISDLEGNLARFDHIVFGEFNASHKESWPLRNQYSLGASVLPGIYASPESVYYLRLGVVRSKISMNTSTSANSPFNGLYTNYPQIHNIQNAFQFGIGNEVQLTSCLSFRQEYTYEQYGKKTKMAQSELGDDFGTPAFVLRTPSIHPNIDKFSWSLLYHFNKQSNAPDWCSPVTDQGIYYYVNFGASRNASNSWSKQINELIFRDTFAQPPNDLTTQVDSTTTNSQLRNYSGLMSLGWGYLFSNKFFIGGEISGALTSGNKSTFLIKGLSNYLANYTIKFTVRDLYNVLFTLRPGYQINDRVSFYGLIGATMNVSKANSIYNIAGNPLLAPQPDLNNAMTYKRKIHLWGFTTGAGVETTICKGLCVSTDLIFTFFGKTQRISPIIHETLSTEFFPGIDYFVDESKRSHGASFVITFTKYFGR